jgi:phage terminase large subunit GpA-like protein
VYAVQGSTVRISKAISLTPSYPTKTVKGKIIKSAYAIWNVGTEYCKDFIFGSLASDGNVSTEERIFRFPSGLEDDYFDGLLSEMFDHEKNKYVPKAGARYKRNEPLDTLVYAWAIGHHKNVLIGITRKGEKNPAYWVRRSGLLETGLQEADPLPIVIDEPVIPAPAIRPPRRPQNKRSFSVGSFRERFRNRHV